MSNYQSKNFFLFLIIFLIPLFFKFIGIIRFDFISTVLLGLMLVGLALVYFYFGTKNKIAISIGSTFFFVGFLIFLLQRFPILDYNKIIFPSIFFIVGFNFLLQFLNNIKEKNLLWMAVIILSINLLLISIQGSLNIYEISNSIKEIITEYWIIFLIIIFAMAFLIFEDRN